MSVDAGPPDRKAGRPASDLVDPRVGGRRFALVAVILVVSQRGGRRRVGPGQCTDHVRVALHHGRPPTSAPPTTNPPRRRDRSDHERTGDHERSVDDGTRQSNVSARALRDVRFGCPGVQYAADGLPVAYNPIRRRSPSSRRRHAT
jgi:hypothetical protein